MWTAHPFEPTGPARKLPLWAGAVPAGFPSPAENYVESALDLNDYLVAHPAATFFVRTKGRSMEGAHIFDGDILVVDRALTAADGSIVIAALDDAFTVKYFRQLGARCWLQAASPPTWRIAPKEGQHLSVWGVVVGCVRKLR